LGFPNALPKTDGGCEPGVLKGTKGNPRSSGEDRLRGDLPDLGVVAMLPHGVLLLPFAGTRKLYCKRGYSSSARLELSVDSL
jgi:hypothetical protein